MSCRVEVDVSVNTPPSDYTLVLGREPVDWERQLSVNTRCTRHEPELSSPLQCTRSSIPRPPPPTSRLDHPTLGTSNMQARHEYTFFFCSPEASATKLGGGVWTGGGGGSRWFCFCINRWEQRGNSRGGETSFVRRFAL